MKVPFIELDQTFGQQTFDWIQELGQIGKLKPLQCALIRGNEVVAGLTCHVDGGKGGFGAVLYMSVKNNMDSPDLTQGY